MSDFDTKYLRAEVDAVAPDGFEVRLLVRDDCASCAHFQLAAGQTGRAGAHKTVTEIWFITGGRGEMWRQQDGHDEVVELKAGAAVTVPVGTKFQSRSIADEPLTAIGVTIPAWPNTPDEWYEVAGKWTPTVGETALAKAGGGEP